MNNAVLQAIFDNDITRFRDLVKSPLFNRSLKNHNLNYETIIMNKNKMWIRAMFAFDDILMNDNLGYVGIERDMVKLLKNKM